MTTTTQNTGLSFSNPVYELSNPSAGESTLEGINNLPDSMPAIRPVASTATVEAPTPSVGYKVEYILTPGACSSSRFGDLKSGLESRIRVIHAIYPYMVSIALAYCVTLSLYPGIETEIISCNLKSWMPVLLMFTFNSSDLIGKVRTRYLFMFFYMHFHWKCYADDRHRPIQLDTPSTNSNVWYAYLSDSVVTPLLCTSRSTNHCRRSSRLCI